MMVYLSIDKEDSNSDNKDIKDFFSSSAISGVGNCNLTKYIAIYPARLALSEENTKKTLKQISLDLPSLENRNYLCRRLRDGWLYAFYVDDGERNNDVYEYKIMNDKFSGTRIFKYSTKQWQDNITKERDYIRCPNNLKTIRLFYSPVPCTKEWLTEKIQSASYYIWQREIKLRSYCSTGFPMDIPLKGLVADIQALIKKLDTNEIPKLKIGEIESGAGRNPINAQETANFNLSRFTNLRNEITSDLKKIKKKFTETDKGSITIIDEYIKKLDDLSFTSTDYYDEYARPSIKLATPEKPLSAQDILNNKMAHQLYKDRIYESMSTVGQARRYYHQIVIVPKNQFRNILLLLKESLTDLLYDHTFYTDRTAPIRLISKFISDLDNGKNQFSSTSTIISKGNTNDLDLFQTIKGPKTAKSIIDAVNTDTDVKDNPLNMLVILDDITAISQDLILSLSEPSYQNFIFNTNNCYANTVAMQVYNTLTGHPYNPLSKYSHNFKNGIKEINKDALKPHLKKWGKLEQENNLKEKNLIKWIDYLNKNISARKFNFCTQHGFDNTQQEQLVDITHVYMHAYSMLCKSIQGKKWIESQVIEETPITSLIAGFSSDLATAINDYLKQYTSLILTKEKSLDPLDPIQIATQGGTTIKSFMDPIDWSSFTSGMLYQNLSDNTKKVFSNICNDTRLKEFIVTISISIGSSITDLNKFINTDHKVLTYAILPSLISNNKISLVSNTPTIYNQWRKDNILAIKEVENYEKLVNIDNVNKDRSPQAKQRFTDFQKKQKMLQDNMTKELTFYSIETYQQEIHSTPSTTYSTESTQQTDNNYKSKIPTSKLDALSVITVIEFIMNVWQATIINREHRINKLNLTLEQTVQLSQCNVAVLNSLLNIWLEKAKKIDLPYLKKKGNINNVNALEGKINNISQAIAVVGVVLSTLTLIADIYTLTKATNKTEAAFLAANVGLSCVSVCLGIAAVAIGTANPAGAVIGVISAVIAGLSFIFGLLASLFRKTQLQLWLKYCYWGKEPQWRYKLLTDTGKPLTDTERLYREMYALSYLSAKPSINSSVTNSSSLGLVPTLGSVALTRYIINSVNINLEFSKISDNQSVIINIYGNDTLTLNKQKIGRDSLKYSIPINSSSRELSKNTVTLIIKNYLLGGYTLLYKYSLSFSSISSSDPTNKVINVEEVNPEKNLFEPSYNLPEIQFINPEQQILEVIDLIL